MCVGRTPDEALDIVLDALPTALELRPGLPPAAGIAADRTGVAAAARRCPRRSWPSCGSAPPPTATAATSQVFLGGRQALVPRGRGPGRRRARPAARRSRAPLDPETDRVLVRTAANLVGTTLETANVLEVARRKDDFLAMLGHELRNPARADPDRGRAAGAPPLGDPRAGGDRAAHASPGPAGGRPARHLPRHPRPRRAAERAGLAGLGARARGGDRRTAGRRAIGTRSRSRSAEDVTLQGDPVRLAQIFGNLLDQRGQVHAARGARSTCWSSARPAACASPCATTASASPATSWRASSSRSCRPTASATRSAAGWVSASPS